ncbi:MAG: hypothetical protein HOG85_05195, partial [Flavobacteriales bacterium]|nr:hypothetical protein [Flavobacteriales bacterium]
MEIWPTKANANELELNSSINYGLVPLNEDGSIDVNINSSSTMMDINIACIGDKDVVYYPEHGGAVLAVRDVSQSD